MKTKIKGTNFNCLKAIYAPNTHTHTIYTPKIIAAYTEEISLKT